MIISKDDILTLDNKGFIRNVYPAFNVSENRFAYKSSYTRDLYLTLTGEEPIEVFFFNGILKGKIIKEYDNSIDFLISTFNGKAYTTKNPRKYIEEFDLEGTILLNLNKKLYSKIEWQDEVAWSNEKSEPIQGDWEEELISWDSDDNSDRFVVPHCRTIDGEEEYVIDTLHLMMEDYMENSESELNENKKSYMTGVSKALMISIESLNRGGLEKGIDALANVYQKNSKDRFDELKALGHLGEEYYICAGMLWGYRQAIEYVSGFSESWQYGMRAEDSTLTIDELNSIAFKYPRDINIRDTDDNNYLFTGLAMGILGTFIGNLLSHKYIFKNKV